MQILVSHANKRRGKAERPAYSRIADKSFNCEMEFQFCEENMHAQRAQTPADGASVPSKAERVAAVARARAKARSGRIAAPIRRRFIDCEKCEFIFYAHCVGRARVCVAMVIPFTSAAQK